jgi:hypothetical protein
MYTRQTLCTYLSLATLLGALASCSGTKQPGEFVNALPLVAIASPIAGSPASNSRAISAESRSLTVYASITKAVDPLLQKLDLSSPNPNQSTTLQPLGAATDSLRQVAQGSISSSMKHLQLWRQTENVNCFGKGHPYRNHPDGGPDSSTRSGETGFESTQEAIDGIDIACPALAMNTKVSELGGIVNEALRLAYVGAAALDETEVSLPRKLKETRGAKLPDGKVLKGGFVTVERTGAEDKLSYLWHFTASTNAGGSRFPVQFWLSHRPTTNGQAGRFWGALPKGTDWYGFTLTYEISPTNTRYELKSAQSTGSRPSPTPDLFLTNGLVNFSSKSRLQNLFYVVSDLETRNGLGSLKATWTASPSSPRSQVLEVRTTPGAQGRDKGTAYFGYGEPLSDSAIARKQVGHAQSMVCAWTAGNKSFAKTGKAAELNGYVQAMNMERNTATGEFEPIADETHIRFCPTQSCNGAKNMIYSGAKCEGPHGLAKVGIFGHIRIDAPSYP